MAEYEQAGTVQASLGAVFDYVAEPTHLPQYVATMVQAERSSPGHLRVAADVQGRHEEGDATFRPDPARHRVEWGGDRRDYRGWMQVDEDSLPGTSRLTIHLSTRDEADRADIEHAIMQTLVNVQRALASG